MCREYKILKADIHYTVLFWVCTRRSDDVCSLTFKSRWSQVKIIDWMGRTKELVLWRENTGWRVGKNIPFSLWWHPVEWWLLWRTGPSKCALAHWRQNSQLRIQLDSSCGKQKLDRMPCLCDPRQQLPLWVSVQVLLAGCSVLLLGSVVLCHYSTWAGMYTVQ